MVVEADETYFGNTTRLSPPAPQGQSGLASKRAVVSLAERGGNVVRSTSTVLAR